MFVIDYIIIIALMGIIMTFLVRYETKVSFILLNIGAWISVISDIIIGVDKFVIQFKFERVIIMFT
jgi:hypothetical protein